MSGETLVNAETGEVIAEMTPDEARKLTDQLRVTLGGTWELMVKAYEGRAWAALGYPSWDAYCTTEFPHAQLRLPREDRDEVIGSLRDAGLSIRAIAATGVASKKTVERTIAASGVANDDTSTVTGTDGKTYPTTPAIEAARARREQQPPARDPGKCTEGFDCPATPGPDGMCAWHRGKARANKTAEPEGAPPAPPAPDTPPAVTPPAEAATGDGAPVPGSISTDAPNAGPPVDGGVEASAPSAPPLPPDWRDRVAGATYLLGLDPVAVAAAASPDDVADLTELAGWLARFTQAMEEQE